MKRHAEKKLLEWKVSPRRKPLLIRGARQVGKTWLVEHFLARHFDRTIKIDLEKRRDLHGIFGGNLDPKKIVSLLELASEKIVPGKTLLFIDEIQACPRAITALRYFHEELPELHLIAAGSLLEFAFDQSAVPVGRVQYLNLFPMTFQEYLTALNKAPMAERVAQHPAAIPAEAHRLILDELKTYFFTGGMPECVKHWRDTGSLKTVAEIQENILVAYRDDFSKYTPSVDANCLDSVLMNVARSIGEQLKYTRLDQDFTGVTNRKAFEALNKARVIHRIPACDPSGLPLGASANPRKFKAAFLDIGLMQRLCGIPAADILQESDLLNLYRGKLAEQFAAQEMAVSSDLFYWSREKKNSQAEIDLLAVQNGDIYPVEIKAGAAGSLRSLHLMLETYPDCPAGIVLSSRPYAVLPEQKLIFAPLYSAARLTQINLSVPGT